MGSFSAEEYFYKMDNMVICSCQLLRKLFQARWKEKTGRDWEQTEEQGKMFLESEDGMKVERKAQKMQKEMIEKGCLDEWDVSLLSMVLQIFGDQNFYKVENEAVKRLTKLRNELAHHPTKKLGREEYNKRVELFKESLQALRAETSEIEKIIEKAGISSSKAALEATKKLLEMGVAHMKTEQFEKAVACFDEAATMPSLLPVHQGSVYEKRADCYLKQAKYLKKNQKRNDSDKCVEQAMLDATLALELNDSSWNAHFLLAQCHQWNVSYGKAIQHYNRALALSPVQKHVKSELDSCKVLAGARERNDNMNPQVAPRTLAEQAETLAEVTGRYLTEEQFITHETTVKGAVIEGQDQVFRGHQYWNGWSVPQSYEEAARHYAKAAEVGNAEGVYSLAKCYKLEMGVTQDLQKAYNLFLQAANMPPNDPWITSGGKVGVFLAQHTLGLWFHHGILVKQDYFEAVKWYEKAAENGCGAAANNLGCMYKIGQVVPRNEKKAEMYWTQALVLKAPNAAVALMKYYIKQMEPDKARAMFQTGRQLGSIELSLMSDDDFNKLVESTSLERKEREADVIEYERMHKLEAKGMTFLERLQRQLIVRDSLTEKFLKYFQEMGNNERWGGQLRFSSVSNLKIMERMAKEGSTTAKNVLSSIRAGLELFTFIMKNGCESVDAKKTALELLYKCCIGEYHVASIYLYADPVKNKLQHIIGELFESKCGKKGEEDMEIRLCYVYYFKALAMTGRDTFMIDILKEGAKMYPDNVHFYEMLSNLYGFASDPKSALEWAEKGLEKFPTDVSLLYSKASYLRQLPESRYQDIVAAYNTFFNQAPPDHRFVPQAYYHLAMCKFEQLHEVDPELKMMELVEQYFNMGKEAEGRMLPCYLPYCESDAKRGVENFLSLEKAKEYLSSQSEPKGEFSKSTSPSQPAPKPILERKQYLASPVRKEVVLRHRQNVSNIKIMLENPTCGQTQSPKLRQAAPRKLSHLKPITLSEMNPTSDHIFEDRIIDLTLIEDPCFGFPSIYLVAEDENGDVTRLYIYNVEQNKEAEMNLAHGSTIAIMNPYMRIGSLDGTNALRNDESNCLIYLDKLTKMCRFCGEENAEQKCSKCKKACYCSKECQEFDWKRLKHKLICSI